MCVHILCQYNYMYSVWMLFMVSMSPVICVTPECAMFVYPMYYHTQHVEEWGQCGQYLHIIQYCVYRGLTGHSRFMSHDSSVPQSKM